MGLAWGIYQSAPITLCRTISDAFDHGKLHLALARARRFTDTGCILQRTRRCRGQGRKQYWRQFCAEILRALTNRAKWFMPCIYWKRQEGDRSAALANIDEVLRNTYQNSISTRKHGSDA